MRRGDMSYGVNEYQHQFVMDMRHSGGKGRRRAHRSVLTSPTVPPSPEQNDLQENIQMEQAILKHQPHQREPGRMSLCECGIGTGGSMRTPRRRHGCHSKGNQT